MKQVHRVMEVGQEFGNSIDYGMYMLITTIIRVFTLSKWTAVEGEESRGGGCKESVGQTKRHGEYMLGIFTGNQRINGVIVYRTFEF